MNKFDDLLAAAAAARLDPSEAAVEALGQRLALEPKRSALDFRRDLRRLTACMIVAGVFGAMTSATVGLIEREAPINRWPAAALAVQPSSLFVAGVRG